MFISPSTKVYWLTGFAILLIVAMLIALSVGQLSIPLTTTFNILLYKLGLSNNHNFSLQQEAVIWFIRLPRIIIAVLVGMALALAGAVMQALFSNPLADPGIIGVSSGAATGAVIAIALGISTLNLWVLPAMAFIGATVAIMLAIMLALNHGKIPVMVLLLAGVVISILLGAVNSGILTFMNEQQLHKYLFWMIGGLDYRRWEHVYIAVIPIFTGIALLLLLARHLNILVLGDTEARSIGMPVLRYRLMFLFITTLITATAVCVSGNIGFVGLIIPHIVRMFFGPDHRYLLPASCIVGALFLLLCDTLGRIIMPPTEIRVGIMTAIIGGPYFLYLLRRLRRYNMF